MPIVTEGRAVIDAPAQAAWAVLADYANDPLWRQGVDRMEQTPPGEALDGAQVVEGPPCAGTPDTHAHRSA